MNIVILSLNYFPEKTGIGKYNTEMAEHLTKLGHNVTMITAAPYYPEWQISEGYENSFSYELFNGVDIYRCPLYVPSQPTTLSRLLHLVSFSLSSGFRLFSLRKRKIDAVVMVQPTFFCAPLTLLFCKLFKATSVMHVQDFELDAMLGLEMGGDRLKKVMFKLESLFLKRFDKVSSISLNMLEKIVQKGVNVSKTVFFPNWADISMVTPDKDGSTFRQKNGIAPADFLVLYSGNLGEKQGLEILMDVAKILETVGAIKFLVVGNGASLSKLKSLKESLKLTNLSFLPLQERDVLPNMLAAADLHLVIQKKGVADAVLPSKLTNILACGGRAVVTAELNTELGKISFEHSGIYRLVEPESTKELSDAILQEYYRDDVEDFNKIARDYAETNLDITKIVNRFLEGIGVRE